jgi:hypothetical protein
VIAEEIEEGGIGGLGQANDGREHQRIERNASFEGSVRGQRRPAETLAGGGPPAADGEAEHERGDHGADGEGADAQGQVQPPEPDDLVQQSQRP